MDELRGKDAARDVIQKCLDAYIEKVLPLTKRIQPPPAKCSPGAVLSFI